MKKNVASQIIGAQMISSTDGSAFTGTVSCLVLIDGGTQTAGGGTVTHEGNGFHSYTPTQAETNGNHLAFTFTGTGAVPTTIQVYTTFPQTADVAAGVTLAANQHVITDSGTVTTLTNLPAAPTDWLSAAAVKADAVTKIQSGLSTYSGVDTGGTTTLLTRLTATRAGYLDNLDAAITTRMATFTYTAPPSAADVWGHNTRTLTAFGFSVAVSDKTGFSLSQSFPANFASLGISAAGKINGVLLADTTTTLTNAPNVPSAVAIRQEIDANSTQIAGIKAKTDNLPANPSATGDAMTLTVAYDAAKTAASAASVAAIPTTPLLASGYTAPDNEGITAIQTALANIEGAGFDPLTDSLQQIRDNLGGGTIDAAGIRSAIGLETANLDTQLAALPTATEIENAVLDSLQAGHQTAGTVGASIKAGGNAGDPWAATDEDLALYPQSSAGWTIHRFNIGQPDAPLTVIPGLPPEDIVCRVYGTLKTPGNVLAVGASVTFELIMQDPIESNAIIVGRVVEATTDSSGRLSINGHPYLDLERNDRMNPTTSHWAVTSFQIGWNQLEFTLTDGLFDLATLIG